MRVPTRNAAESIDLDAPTARRRVLPRGGPQIRWVLVAGFAVTGGIWLGAGYYFSVRMGELETQATRIGERHSRGQEVLSDVRSHLYRGSLILRDALLDAGAGTDEYATQSKLAYDAAMRSLDDYELVRETPGERDRVNRLRDRVVALRAATVGVLARDGGDTGDASAGALLAGVVPTRDAAILVATELQELNREAYVAQQRETAELYRATQWWFWVTLGFGVLASLAIALLSGIHVGRLERGLRSRHEADARTAEELHRLSTRLVSAQEDERRVIARELHDEIGQVLTVIKLELAYAQRQVAAGGLESPAALQEARTAADRALQAVRDTLHELHPPLLEELGLVAALDWYVQNVERRHGLTVSFTRRELGGRLPAATEVALYRVIQEAVTNVLRHARAGICQISLTRPGDLVTISVGDNGVGFSPAAVQKAESGLGLISIRERIAELDGDVRLESNPGQGTLLTVSVPVRPERRTGAAPMDRDPAGAEAG